MSVGRIKVSLAISHTPWVPERVSSYLRLRDALCSEERSYAAIEVFSDREPNHMWSEKMWAWSVAQDVDWCLFLQDDSLVAPFFLQRVCNFIRAHEHVDIPVIGLHVAHPAATLLAQEGYEAFTTSDGIVGVGYALNRIALEVFLEWRRGLKPGALEALSEDTLVGLFCASRLDRVLHPIPALVDHDTAIPSVYGNDAHPNRRSRVRWDTPIALATKERPTAVPHLGRFYESTPRLLRDWVPAITDRDVRASQADNGAAVMRRLNYGRLARGGEPTAKVMVATPTRGQVHPQYAATVWRLQRDEQYECLDPIELYDVSMWQSDVVRVRSRYVQHFLHNTDATHLFFLDDDIEMLPKVLRGMLAANVGFIAAPYPRREGVDWERVRQADESTHPEALAYRYCVRLGPAKLDCDSQGKVKVGMVPLGCALLSRELLDGMWAHYQDADGFLDEPGGIDTPCVALFGLMWEPKEGGGRGLLSEDYSFSKRVRNMGEDVWLYLGDGSPVNHHGSHAYKGHLAAFGLRRA